MSSTLAARYLFSDTAEITMLSQLGIATNAGGYSGGYSQSKLRGYLENTVKDGRDLRSVSVYRMGKEYFVTADIAGKQKDLHIIRYGNGYDFENVFIPSDE